MSLFIYLFVYFHILCLLDLLLLLRCVDYGILPIEEAEKLHQKCLKRKGKLKGTASALSPVKDTLVTKRKKKKKAKLLADDDGPDMQILSGDAVGKVVL